MLLPVNVLVMMAGWTLPFISGAELVACPTDTVSVDVTSAAGMQSLTDAMNCSGEGFFNATLYSSVQIGHIIEVSGQKTVHITGSGFPTIRAALLDNNESSAVTDAGNITGIFLVSGGSTLTINALVLEGGYSEDGGAVAVLSSSSLYAFECVFENNTATTGGDKQFGTLSYYCGNNKNNKRQYDTLHFLTASQGILIQYGQGSKPNQSCVPRN